MKDEKWEKNPFAKKYKEKNEASEKKRKLAAKIK